MNRLFINGDNKGNCSRPRQRGYGEAYSFLMNGGYYISVEHNNIKNFIAVEGEDIDSIDYVIETYG